MTDRRLLIGFGSVCVLIGLATLVLVQSHLSTIERRLSIQRREIGALSDNVLHPPRTWQVPAYSARSLDAFTQARQPDCAPYRADRTAIIVVAGQSNAANAGEAGYVTHHPDRVGQFWQGRCARAVEPLIGATGEGGSPWIRMADQLIEAGRWDRVLLVAVAVDGTGMGRWRAGGDLNALLVQTLADLHRYEMRVTHVLWVQGEADRSEQSRFRRDGGTPYLDGLQDIANVTFQNSNAHLFVALATSCSSHSGVQPSTSEIRAAQIAITHENIGTVVQGPDLDALNSSDDRFDNCHLSRSGLAKFARSWSDILLAQPESETARALTR